MRRKDDWSHLLEIFIWERSDQPFVWGSNDCCTFAADWIRRCTGEDVDDKWRGTYSTALGALLHVCRAGGVAKLPLQAGLEPVHRRKAQRGDIVGLATSFGLALGVSTGELGYFPGRQGLVALSSRHYLKAWRV